MITLSLGIVAPTSTTTGTIATANRTDLNPAGVPPKSLWCQAVSFQAIGTNGNTVYICDTATPNFTTGIGILWELPAPAASPANASRPAWVIGDPTRANNAVNVAQFYIVPSVSGEGVRVSALRSGTNQNFLS